MTTKIRDRSSEPATSGAIIAGLGGGSGKSVVAVGLTAAFTMLGQKVVPFKKGPDYIDAGWLQLAAGQPCYNLDPYLMSEAAINESFATHAAAGFWVESFLIVLWP